MSSFKPATRVSRPPIHNPYDKFSKPDFEDWIGNLTGTLRHALGHDQPSSAASTQTNPHTENEKYDSISNVDGRLSSEAGQEADSLSANGSGHSREQRRGDLGRQSSVLSTGDDPSQPIELDLDSEEDEKDDHSAVYEEIDEEEDYSGSQQDEPHEDAEIHVNGFTTHNYDMENDSEEHDEAETVIPRRPFDAPTRETQLHSDDEPEITVIEDDEEENYGSENEEDDANAIELPDVWEGPEEYAEDYYAGGDAPAIGVHRSASPSHLEELSDTGVSDEEFPGGDHVSEDELEDNTREIDDPAGEDLPIQADDGPTPELVDPWLGPAQYAEDFYSGGDAPLRHVSTLADPSNIEGTPQEHEALGFSSDAFALPGQQKTDGVMHAQPDEILDVDAEDWSTIQEVHGKIPDLYHDDLAVQGDFVAGHDDIPVYGVSGTKLFERYGTFSHEYASELAPQYSDNIRDSIAGMPPNNPDLLTGGVSSFVSDPINKAEPDASHAPEALKDVDMAKKPNVEEAIAHEIQEQVVHAEPLGTTETAPSPPALPLDPILAGEGKEPPTPSDAEAPAGQAEQDISLEPDLFSIDVGPEPQIISQHTGPDSGSSLPNPSGISRARRPTLRDQMPEINPVQPPLSDTPNALPTPLMMAIPQARLDDLLTSVRRGDLNAATDYFPRTPGLSTDQPAWPTDLPNEPALDGAAPTFIQPVEELLDFIVANNIDAFDQPAETTGGGHFGYDYAVEEAVAFEMTSVEGGDIEVQSVDSSHILNENSASYEVEERTTTEPQSPVAGDTNVGISITVESAEESTRTSPQPKARRPTFIRMPSSTLASVVTSMKTATPSDLPAVHQHQVPGTPSILLLSHPPTPGTPPPLSVPVTPRALEELQARRAGAALSTSHRFPSRDRKDSTEEPITNRESAHIEPASSSLEEAESSNLADAKEETVSEAYTHSAEDDAENTKGSSVESVDAKADREGPQTQRPESESVVTEQEPEQATSAEAKITSLEDSVDPFTLMGTDSKVAPGEVDDDATPVGELERESVTPDTKPDASLSTRTITLNNATDETESASPKADKTVPDIVKPSQEVAPTRKRKRSAVPSSTRVLRSISTLGRRGKGKQNVVEDDASSQASSVHTASSGSSTNAVANMLSIRTKGSDSRASSVVSDATSASSFMPILSPTDPRHHLLPEPVHDSVHHHHHHHHHTQPVLPPPSKTSDQAEAAVPVPPSKPPSSVRSRAASPAPSTSSVSSTAPKPRKPKSEAVVTESPVTRSNCRFHKISIPRSEGGRRINFSIPGCALGNMELMKDEDIQDHGVVPPDEFRRRQNNLDAFRLPVPLVAIVHQLVGIELQRQGEIFYLPDEAELQQARHRLTRDLKKARNSPVKLSQARRLTASALSRRETATLSAGPSMSPQTSASASISSIGRSPSKARERRHLPPGPMSSISDDEGLTELEGGEEEGEEERNEEPKLKRQKRKANTGESMLSASVGPGSGTPTSEAIPTGKARRGRKLAPDAAAYQPADDESDESTGEDVSVKRKGRKRGRTSVKGDHDDGESSRQMKKMKKRTVTGTSTQDETAAVTAAEDV